MILCDERVAAWWGEDPAGEQPAVGRLRAIVPLAHAGAVALFGDQFADGLKKVHVEPQDLVHGLERQEGCTGAVAMVPDVAAEDGAIALLDIGLIVLAVGAAAGEPDALLATPRDEDVVEELPAIVGVEAPQGHREGAAGEVDSGADALVALAPDGLQFGPPGGDVGGEKRGEEEAAGAFPQCASKSACRWPGETSAHSVNVRSGTCARKAARLGLVVATPWRRWSRRTACSSRSIVAGLMCRRAVRCSAESVSSSCRSRASIRSGRKGAKRLEHR